MLKAAALHVRSCVLVLGLGCAMAGSHAKAQSNAHQHFGKVHFPIACNDGVQEQFDLALAMLHTFSFPDAAQTFTAVAQKDPDCAMAYWGIAATAIGSLYGGRPGPMALQGEQAVEKAKAIRGKNARERDYIATVEVFCKGAGAAPSQIPRGSRGRNILRLCPVGARGADRSDLHIPTSRRCYPREALCRSAGSSWRDPLSPARLRQHAICVARADGRASVGQGSAFVAACAAISRSHL